MDAFFLSAVAGFSVTTLLMASWITDPGDRMRLRIGRALEVTARRPVFIVVVSFAAILLTVLVVMLVLARVHPSGSVIYTWGDYLSGPLFSSVVLGLLFGVLFAFWLRELLKLPDDKAIDRKHIIQAIVLAILLLIGAFSDILRSYASRITQLSLGGAQVSFTPSKSTDEGRRGGAAVQVPATGGTPTGAGALPLIKSLPGRIVNDAHYINEVFRKTPNQVESAKKAPWFFAAMAEIAGCVAKITEISGDESFERDHLQELQSIVRTITISRDQTDVQAAAKRMSDAFGGAIEQIKLGYLHLDKKNEVRTNITNECKEFIIRACPVHNASVYAPIALENCRRRSDLRLDQFKEELAALLKDPALFERPHLYLLDAGLLWRRGRHQEAAEELDGWVSSQEKLRGSKNDNDPSLWYIVRARIYLGIIIEEWLGAAWNSPGALIEYHIQNLWKTAEDMRSLLGAKIDALGEVDDSEAALFAKGLPAGGNSCAALKPNEIELLLSWVQLYPTYMRRATQSPNYYDQYSADVMTARRLLLKTDLHCIANTNRDYRAYVKKFYAEFLQAYAEVELANAARVQLLPDPDAVKRSVNRAHEAAALGLRLIKAYKADPPNTTDSQKDPGIPIPLAQQIAPNDADVREIENQLKSVQRRAAAQLKQL